VPEALAEQGKIGSAAVPAGTAGSIGTVDQGMLIFLPESFHMFTLSEFLQLFAVR
jgi:hypothetical protein